MKNYKFPLTMIGSIVVGCILGIIFKSDVKYIKPLADIFVNLMFMIVIPIIFFTITASIANMRSLNRLSKILKYVLIVFIGTSLISSIIGLLFSLNFDFVSTNNIILETTEIENTSFLDSIASMITVNDFYLLFSRKNILPLIIFSCLLGFSLSRIDRDKKIIEIFNTLSKTSMYLMKIVMYYAPIGICAYFASLVGEFGFEVIKSYFNIFICYLVITILYYLIVYAIYAYIAGGIDGVKKFYKYSFLSVVTSLGTASSLATLPSTIDASNKMGIDEDVSSIALPLGTTIHMEGSCIASIFKIFFLLSVFNIEINFSTCVIAIIISILSGVVMSGIPGGGLIGEALIVNMYGFPASGFVLISTIGWLVDSPATMLNAVGDLPSLMMVDKLVKRA